MQTLNLARYPLGSILSTVNRFAESFAIAGFCEAKDIAQSAMLKVLTRKNEHPPTTGWLYKAVRSVAFDAGRKYAMESKYRSDSQCPSGAGPVRQSDFDRLWFESVLDRLSPKHQQVLVLHAEGLRYDQIAVIVGCRTPPCGLVCTMPGRERGNCWRCDF